MKTSLFSIRFSFQVLAVLVVFSVAAAWLPAQLWIPALDRAMTPEEEKPYRNDPVKPFRIADNLYFVGPTQHMPSYLFTSPQGHVLLDTALDESVPTIRANIESLGFRLRDIKIILSSHSHHDHVGGHAAMKELTGAEIWATEGDADVIRSGGKTDFRPTEPWHAAPVDRILQDGEVVELGSTSLMAHLTPGHTKGCTTWTTVATDRGKSYNVVIYAGTRLNRGVPLVGNTKYPEIAQDYMKAFAKLKSLPVDIYLGSHGWWFGITKKLKRMAEGHGTRAFIDPHGYWDQLEYSEGAFLKQLKKEKEGM